MGIKVTVEQQFWHTWFLERGVLPLLEAIEKGFDYNPGQGDLDNE